MHIGSDCVLGKRCIDSDCVLGKRCIDSDCVLGKRCINWTTYHVFSCFFRIVTGIFSDSNSGRSEISVNSRSGTTPCTCMLISMHIHKQGRASFFLPLSLQVIFVLLNQDNMSINLYLFKIYNALLPMTIFIIAAVVCFVTKSPIILS